MQVHEVKPKHKNKSKKRVGRGGKRGTYCGHGEKKGQHTRSGRTSKPLINELIKKFPKLRGSGQRTNKKPVEVVNLCDLNGKFKKGEKITPQVLYKKGLIRKENGKIPRVKILGDGDLKKELKFENCKVSSSAKKKIEKAGGEIK